MQFDNLRGKLHAKRGIAEYAVTSIATVDRWIKAGKVKVIRLSPGATRLDGDSLADFLESRIAVPSTPRGKNASRTS